MFSHYVFVGSEKEAENGVFMCEKNVVPEIQIKLPKYDTLSSEEPCITM
jgi:hypothetical protein